MAMERYWPGDIAPLPNVWVRRIAVYKNYGADVF